MNKVEESKVSVVIPVYNAENYLKRNIGSLLNQSYTNFELIYVDDGSVDASSEILDSYADADSRMTVIHNSNHGVSYTRNCGINAATGKYITFVDADDYVDTDYVKYLVNAIEQLDVNMFVSLTHHFDDGQSQDEKLFIDTASNVSIINDIYLNKIYMAVWNKIYNLSFINEHGIRFNDKIWYAEGMHFNIQCLSRLDKIGIGNRKVYHYVTNPNSAMRKGFKLENEKCALRSLDLQREILSSRSVRTNTLEYHYMMVNFQILYGIIGDDLTEQNENDLTECLKSIRKRKFIPLIVNLPVKTRVKWCLIGIFPRTMAQRQIRLMRKWK